jgi:nitroreductase
VDVRHRPGQEAGDADYYGANFDKYINLDGVQYGADDLRTGQRDGCAHRRPTASTSTKYRSCSSRPEGGPPRRRHPGRLLGVDPAVWSFQLALRSRGLGSAWTTLHLSYEAEVAELLGIPPDRYSQAGLFPIAYTKGTDFRLAKRLPAEQFAHFDSW